MWLQYAAMINFVNYQDSDSERNPRMSRKHPKLVRSVIYHDATWFQANLFLLLIFATFLCAQGGLKTVKQIGCVTYTSLCVGWNTPPFAFRRVLHQRLNLSAHILVNISCKFGLCTVRKHMFQQSKAEVKRFPHDSWIWFSITKGHCNCATIRPTLQWMTSFLRKTCRSIGESSDAMSVEIGVFQWSVGIAGRCDSFKVIQLTKRQIASKLINNINSWWMFSLMDQVFTTWCETISVGPRFWPSTLRQTTNGSRLGTCFVETKWLYAVKYF